MKGMEMPKNCIDCPLTKPYRCRIAGIFFTSEDESWIYKQRPNWCPLTEVKAPHGRLIDRNEIRMPEMDTDCDKVRMMSALAATPTVIQEER